MLVPLGGRARAGQRDAPDIAGESQLPVGQEQHLRRDGLEEHLLVQQPLGAVPSGQRIEPLRAERYQLFPGHRQTPPAPVVPVQRDALPFQVRRQPIRLRIGANPHDHRVVELDRGDVAEFGGVGKPADFLAIRQVQLPHAERQPGQDGEQRDRQTDHQHIDQPAQRGDQPRRHVDPAGRGRFQRRPRCLVNIRIAAMGEVDGSCPDLEQHQRQNPRDHEPGREQGEADVDGEGRGDQQISERD